MEIKTVMVTSKNDKGMKKSITLSDGTFIKLNADSEIKFPKKFIGETREVYLKGEAFFDVKKDTAHPFIIHSGEISTTVKGTSFNIKAFKNEETIKVSVVTGIVEVENKVSSKLTLIPNEEAVYNINDKNIIKRPFDLNEIAWREGVLYFKDCMLGEMITKLERWYGVEFIIENKKVAIKNGYTGKFQNESLNEVLENISFAGNFQFKMEGKKVYIF